MTLAAVTAVLESILFIGQVGATVMVPRSYGLFMRTSLPTRSGVVLFFAAGALCSLTVAFKGFEQPLVAALLGIQAAGILLWAYFLLVDLDRAATRLARAFDAIATKHGIEVLEEVRDTINVALRG